MSSGLAGWLSLESALASVAAVGPTSIDRFRADIDPEWIEQALAATGTATLRRRRLPAEQVIWLVLGMALHRNRSIVEIVHTLDLALPDAHGRPVAASAVPKARARVGPEPLAWLFARCAEAWTGRAPAPGWRGLALYSVDGTTLRVPDSPENRAHFGGHPACGGHGDSGYPLARVVALMELRSHLLRAAAFGPHAAGVRVCRAALGCGAARLAHDRGSGLPGGGATARPGTPGKESALARAREAEHALSRGGGVRLR